MTLLQSTGLICVAVSIFCGVAAFSCRSPAAYMGWMFTGFLCAVASSVIGILT